LAAILDFRHNVALAKIAGDLDGSYICRKPLCCRWATCVSVKPATLLVLPVIWPPSWISTSHDIGSSTAVKFDPENVGLAVGILWLCFGTLDMSGGHLTPLPFVAGKRRRKTVAGTRVNGSPDSFLYSGSSRR